MYPSARAAALQQHLVQPRICGGPPPSSDGRIRRANDGVRRPEGTFALAPRRPGYVSECRVYLPSILCYALLRSAKQGRIQLHGGRGPDKSSLLFQSPRRWRRRGAPLFLLALAHPWRRASAGVPRRPRSYDRPCGALRNSPRALFIHFSQKCPRLQ